jgi:predicted amidohydrolase YtcJ
MTTTLFSGGSVRTLVDDLAIADWLLVDGDRIAGYGNIDDAPTPDRTVDLQGSWLVPAFCDAHVHLPATGLFAAGLDFRGERSARRILEAFAARARSGAGILFGGNFEDPLDAPLARTELDTAVGHHPALLARADMHSAIVSSALLGNLDLAGLEGVDVDRDGRPTGYLREKAAAEAWRWFESNLPRVQLRDAVRTATRSAYRKGVASVHEMYVVEWRGWNSFEIVREATTDLALDITPYVATTDIERVRAMGLRRVGGDLFLDGSFGSHTAWLSDPYDPAPPAGTPPNGIAYRDDAHLSAFFTEAQARGMQTGVHAIGDAAIEQAIGCWEKVAAEAGLDAVRALRHRIEHFECASDDHIARAARLGLAASVQPAFDRFWGGEDGLYARRIGWARASRMNRFRSMLGAGLTLGAGSDSTVTPLDPFLQMAALRDHHRADQRLDGLTALRAHTIGSNALAATDDRLGTLAPGKRADLAWLDRDPAAVDTQALVETEVLGTWIRGTKVWPEGDAETH